MINYILGAIIAVFLILAIRKLIKDRKKDGRCSGCSYAGSCPSKH
ncbi:MAG: FeoB-associated Cys-rich membrane protein [Clostridiales bacterium]|nr:FeoB-associated Cys-rich membrane protein [Clostridiales bacterium]